MLLAPPPPIELPAEALLARLRARRAALDLHGEGGGGPTPDAAMTWLHLRLERSLRTALTPYAEIMAMHSLLVALRHRLGGEPIPAGLLRQPWLAAELPVLLDQPGDAEQVVARLEAWLTDDYQFAAGLLNGYRQQGPGQIEQQLGAGILGFALAKARAPVVRMTVRFLIDVRNLLAVLRHWRWQLRSVPPLLDGGEVSTRDLRRTWKAVDRAAFTVMAARLAAGQLTDLDPRAAERQLLRGLTLRLRRAGRDPLAVGVIIDYLWRCRVAARNRALQQVAGEEGGLLAAALL